MAADKHSSFLQTFINYGCEKSYNIYSWFALSYLDSISASNVSYFYKYFICLFSTKLGRLYLSTIVLVWGYSHDLIECDTTTILIKTLLIMTSLIMTILYTGYIVYKRLYSELILLINDSTYSSK